MLIDGVSKAFAMTGWRIGFSYCEGAGAKKMAAFQSHTTSNPATPSQLAALAAYSDVERSLGDIAQMAEAYERRQRLVVSLMRELLPDLSFVEPGGAFYLFFRVDSACGPDEGSSDFCTRMLEEAGVALVPGSAFGDDRYARMSFATSDDVLSEAIRRMASVLGGVVETLQQPPARPLDDPETLLEPASAPVIGVGDILVAAGLGIELAQEVQTGGAVRGPPQRRQMCEIAAVHRDHVVEVAHVARAYPAGMSRQLDSMSAADRQGTRIGALAHMPGSGSGGIDAHVDIGLVREMDEDAFRQGRPADVA